MDEINFIILYRSEALMINKSHVLTISWVLFSASPAMVMEKIEDEFSTDSTSAILPKICLTENKNNSNDPQNQIPIIAEKKTVISEEEAGKIVPFNHRRKSSGSPRIKIYTAPRSTSPKQTSAFLQNSKKGNEGVGTESISISPDEKKEFIEDLSKTSVERKPKPLSPNCRRYSLIGPMEILQVPIQNSSQNEQTSSLKHKEILPKEESKDQL